MDVQFSQWWQTQPKAAADAACLLAPLDHLGLIEVAGSDAASFLHGQLTQDVQSLQSDQARRAGYCNAKGRLYATFILWRTLPETILLSLAVSSSAFIAKRLSMFVLRAKAKVADVSAQHVQLGVWGAHAIEALQKAQLPVPRGNLAVLQCAHGSVTAIGDNGQRFLIVVHAAHACETVQALCTAGAAAASAAAWRAQDIAQGIAHIDAATQEQFVPQMINFELVGGVNFKKGCYPGQEVVARSQYLGKLKRRMAIAQVQGQGQLAIAPNADVLATTGAEPVGTVVNAELLANGDTALLFESSLAAQDAGGLTVAGHALTLQPLPYERVDVTA